MSVLKSRSENQEKPDGVLARCGVKPDSPVPDMNRRSDHHHPRTQPLLFAPLFSSPSSLHSSSTVILLSQYFRTPNAAAAAVTLYRWVVQINVDVLYS